MPLSADQIALMSRLLDQGLALDAAGRRRFLQELPAQPPALEAALREALLPDPDETVGTGLFATLPRIDAAAASKSLNLGLAPGERVGPYRLVRELGSGGMAVVWLAERADGAFKREVALKFPLLSRLRRDLGERFARERGILAQLEHPNIARLYDAGVTRDGLPYLALEFVEGEPLTTWCDARRYGIRERLQLFLQVLDAVQYAHAHQVIHRDLKPSNILVTDAGQVRLLDFGVAALLSDGQAVEQSPVTRVYGRVLTPDYASPEQLGDGTVGATSDIYALGVGLYELLAGERPYRLKTASSIVPLATVMRGTPIQKPSERIDPAAAAARACTHEALRRRLRGDLDAIVLKALARQAELRYPSARAFAQDLQRCLDGEAVSARSGDLAYRLGKWPARHPLAAVAAAGALALALAAVELKQGAPVPAVPAQKSIAVLPFIDISEAHNQQYLSDGLADELIDQLGRRGELRVIARTSSFQFKDRREDVRSIAHKLGVDYVLEGSVRKAGSMLRVTAQLIRAPDGSHLWSQTYDRAVTDVFKVQDDICDTVVHALHAALTAGPLAHPAAERNIEAYGALLQGWYFYQRASREDLEKSVAAYQQAIELDPSYARAWAELAAAYIRQGSWQWDTVENAYSKARTAAAQALKIDPNQPLAHRMLGYVNWDYDLDREAGQAEFRRSRELDPSDVNALSALTLVALAYGRIDEAIELKLKNAQADPLNSLMLDDLGSLYLDAGRPAEAEAAVRRALALDPAYTGGHCNLGQVLLARGQPEQALKEIQLESDELSRAACLPMAYWSLGQRDEADRTLGDLVGKYADLAAYNIAEILAYEGRKDAAFDWLERAYRQRELGLTMLKVDRLLRSLRTDARFGELLARMKLPR